MLPHIQSILVKLFLLGSWLTLQAQSQLPLRDTRSWVRDCWALNLYEWVLPSAYTLKPWVADRQWISYVFPRGCLLVWLHVDLGNKGSTCFHEVEDEVEIFVILRFDDIEESYDIFMAWAKRRLTVKLLQEHNLSESSLGVCRIVKGIEDLT